MSDKYAKKRQYNKLVRDKIPEYLGAKDVEYKTHIANEAEYKAKLWTKLEEEIAELKLEATAEELADLLEVIYAMADYLGVSRAELEATRQKKLAERGGFKDRIILEES